MIHIKRGLEKLPYWQTRPGMFAFQITELVFIRFFCMFGPLYDPHQKEIGEAAVLADAPWDVCLSKEQGGNDHKVGRLGMDTKRL